MDVVVLSYLPLWLLSRDKLAWLYLRTLRIGGPAFLVLSSVVP